MNCPAFTLPLLLADLRQLVETESPSTDLDALARCAQIVATLGQRRLGQPPEILRVAGQPHLRWRLGLEPRKILVLAHFDTVWPTGSLARHPFRIQDNIIAGPGCFDMKAGLVMALHALAATELTAAGVTFLATSDEEIGSPTSRSLIEAEAEDKTAVLVLEAPTSDGALKTERKGATGAVLHITGRAAHAGLEPDTGANAAIELAHQVLAIAALGDARLGTTVTPTVLSAGTTANTIPAIASAAVDIRVRTTAEQDRVKAAMAGLRPVLADTSLAIEWGRCRPPFEHIHSEALFALAQRLARPLGLTVTEAAVGGASDGNFTAGLGLPTLDGLGAAGGGAHADSEHVLVDSLVPRTQLLWALLDHLAHTPEAAPS
jgi:glutamate carboxypeptidase